MGQLAELVISFLKYANLGKNASSKHKVRHILNLILHMQCMHDKG